LSDFLELDTKALLAVNGGASCSGGSCSSSVSKNTGSCGSSGISYSGSCSSSGGSSYGGSCGTSGGNCSSSGGSFSGSNGGSGNENPSGQAPAWKYVENSNLGVANANVGDRIIRSDGSEVVLTQGDIDWAKAQLEKNATNSESTKTDTELNEIIGVGSCGGTCGGGTVGNDGNGDTSAWNGISPQLVIPTYTQQRDFSKKYGTSFGENACAATSLLNEISEEYTRQTGKALSQEEIKRAMEAAIKSGGISKNNAYINNWVSAANAMADAVGLKGDYSYTTNSSQANATIYAWDNDGDGWADHFVNDIGNGRYYDPWTGTIGNVSELTLATQGDLGGSRDLLYK
jgi:hypothetical protein